MQTEQELKALLQEIAAQDFQPLDRLSPAALLPAMMAHIGSTDPELRDDLIYRTFLRWGLRGVFSPADLRQILTTLLDDDHLFYRLGEQGTDSVFTRTFSALLVPLVLIVHREQPYLTEAEVRRLKERLLEYFLTEQDLRGYNGDKGWAHAIAHGADGLDDLAQAAEMTPADLQDILAALRTRALETRLAYDFNEDDRMAYAAVSLLLRGALADEAVKEWIESFRPFLKLSPPYPENFYRCVNAKHFLRGVYFVGLNRGLEARMLGWIAELFLDR